MAGRDRLQAGPWLRAVIAKLPFALGFAVLWGLTVVPAGIAEGKRGAALLGAVFFHPLLTMAILIALLACVDARWPQHRLKFLFLIVIATMAAVAGLTGDVLFLIGSGIWTQPYSVPLSVVWWGNFGSVMSTCLIAAYAMDSRTRIKQRVEILANVRRERAVVRRRTVEARLQATQARIDPQFLFDVLASVERVREMSVPDGDRLLDDLIAYLRAALPDVVAESTNLGRELALAVAWLDIQCVLRRERLQCKVDIPEALHAVPFPPMTLVPLLEAALAAVSMSESVSLTLDAHAEDRRLQIRVRSSVPIPAEGRRIDELRPRLAELYGATARMTIANAGPSGELVLELPHDDAESRPR